MTAEHADDSLPSLREVEAAAAAYAELVHTTPVVTSRQLSDRAGAEVHFKVEALQRGGSHKVRGAAANLMALAGSDRPPAGVVTASSGNHGQAIAAVSRQLGLPCAIVMPDGSNPVKVEAARAQGAEVVTEGVTVYTRESVADRCAIDRGWVRVHADDHAGVAGFGGVALEILEQVPAAGTILVPLGLGALLSGVALTTKALRPDIRVVGVEPAGAGDAYRSMQAGRIIELDAPPDTIADGARALALSPRTFRALTEYVDDVILVDDDLLLEATYLLMTRTKVVIEPTGALSYAGLLGSRHDRPGPAVCVLSGGNADLVDLGRRFDAAGLAGGRG